MKCKDNKWGVDVKFWLFNVTFGILANNPNTPGKKAGENVPLAWNYLSQLGYGEWNVMINLKQIKAQYC